jgi:hypothetical protein
MAITVEIQAAEKAFRDIMLGGIPFLLRQNETAFLSVICSLTAIDALAGYRYPSGEVGERYKWFIENYFRAAYKPHAGRIYTLRCRMLHNFSPAHFSIAHSSAAQHLQPSVLGSGDCIISDDVFFTDLKDAASKFFAEVHTDVQRQNDMNARLANIAKGGAIFT